MDALAAGSIHLQRRDLQSSTGRGVLKQMRGFTSRCGASVQHPQGLRQIQPLQQQRRRLLCGCVLHRHPAVGKARQSLHRHRLGQLQSIAAHLNCY